MTVTPKKVLIVDDTEDNLELLKRLLVSWGYDVTAVDNGFSAIDLANESRYDTIILDVMMPDIDGIETCRRIREEVKDKVTPIIMLTGLDDTKTLAQCLDAGADDFIGKPFNRIVLQSRLDSAIRRKELEDVFINTNQYLEEKVKERTEELEHTNQELQKENQLRLQKEQELVEFQDQLADIVVQKTRDLELSRDRALSAEKAMTAFLANMTHELRTPLHSILSFTRFAIAKAENDKPDIPAVIDHLHEVKSSGENLLELINNLLDLSKLKAGKMMYEFQPTNLHTLIDQVAHEFSILQEEKWVLIRNQVDRDLTIDLDNSKISQVFRNLLSNALKFSPRNSNITIDTGAMDSSHIEVIVSDEGPGIPEDELTQVFDNFQQSSQTRSNAGGTGLGLAICKEIVEAGHRGLIRAKNNKDQGASFVLYLPRHQSYENHNLWQAKQS
jgi:signal transduction histidine kinase